MAHNPQLRPDEPAGPARVFVLAEDALAGEGLRAALGAESRLQCVERIEDAEVVVWDVGGVAGAGAGSSALLAALRARGQAIVSLVADEASATLALQQGASGVLQRRIHAPTLTAAILAVRVGLCVLDATLADQHLQLAAAPVTRDDDLDALTARERDVLELLALGLANKAIADRLGVSVHTVKFHVNSILAKLGADSRTAAVASALRRGLVSS
jgi:two-component system, NarL family, nitrate/nitrite response regulator NarL